MGSKVKAFMSVASVHDANGRAVGDAYASHMAASALREARAILAESEGLGWAAYQHANVNGVSLGERRCPACGHSEDSHVNWHCVGCGRQCGTLGPRARRLAYSDARIGFRALAESLAAFVGMSL